MSELTAPLGEYFCELTNRRHHLFTGRATTALYLILKKHSITDRSVVIPANICYSIVNAITLTGNRPVFVDVDSDSGNVRLDDLAGIDDSVAAVVAPHMYGNPCADIEAIASLCQQRGALLIEDCALAIGATLNGRSLGCFGDYTLFSFGSGKTIDATVGGLVVSNHSLGEIENLNRKLPEYSSELGRRTRLYSDLYRSILHSGFYDDLAGAFGALNEAFAPIYLYRLREQDTRQIFDASASMDDVCQGRRAIAEMYDDGIAWKSGAVERYQFADGATPWRYNLLIDDADMKNRIIAWLLENQVGVSIWYPTIHRMFGDEGDYPNAARFAQRIVNLPADVTADQATHIAALINQQIAT